VKTHHAVACTESSEVLNTQWYFEIQRLLKTRGFDIVMSWYWRIRVFKIN